MDLDCAWLHRELIDAAERAMKVIVEGLYFQARELLPQETTSRLRNKLQNHKRCQIPRPVSCFLLVKFGEPVSLSVISFPVFTVEPSGRFRFSSTTTTPNSSKLPLQSLVKTNDMGVL